MSGNRSGPMPAGETSNDSIWLGRAERLLAGLVGPELAEVILGDLQELRPGVEACWGKALSWVWLALESARAAGVLGVQRMRPGRRENSSMDNWNLTIRRAAVAIGLIACLPAAVLVVGGLLQSDWSTPAIRSALERTLFNPDLVGFRVLIHPATILSGLVLAAGLNLIPLLRLGLERRPGTLVGTLAIRIRSVHLGVAVAALGLMGVILGYAITENFKVVPTHPVALNKGWQYTTAPVIPVTTLNLGEGSRLLILQIADGADTWQALPTPPADGD